jgi:predicted acyl esterase
MRSAKTAAYKALRMRIPAFAAALLLLVAMSARADDHGVRLVKTSIPMPDGVQLAATLYMPADLQPGRRVPVLLEYLPYRKDDDDAVSDYGHHAYFARHGYVGARVDIRGFGNSQGVQPPREYSAQEQEDGERVIAWLARQHWSNARATNRSAAESLKHIATGRCYHHKRNETTNHWPCPGHQLAPGEPCGNSDA